MKKIMIGFKASKEFKDFLQKIADKENRTLSNFIINALLNYIKQHYSIDYKKDKKDS